MMTVARARPLTPHPNTKVRSGLIAKLRTNPTASALRFDLVSPNAIKAPAATKESRKAGVPRNVTSRYALASGSMSASAPRNRTRGCDTKKPATATIRLSTRASPIALSIKSEAACNRSRPTSGATTADTPVCMPKPIDKIRKNTLPATETPASA